MAHTKNNNNYKINETTECDLLNSDEGWLLKAMSRASGYSVETAHTVRLVQRNTDHQYSPSVCCCCGYNTQNWISLLSTAYINLTGMNPICSIKFSSLFCTVSTQFCTFDFSRRGNLKKLEGPAGSLQFLCWSVFKCK